MDATTRILAQMRGIHLDEFPEADHMATPSEAIREWKWTVGADRPEDCWLLSDRDTWERNPHYVGPPVPHPEDGPDWASYHCQCGEVLYSSFPFRVLFCLICGRAIPRDGLTSGLVGDSRGIENQGNDKNCPF